MDLSTLERAWQTQTVTGEEPADLAAARITREVAIAQRRIRGGIVLVTVLLLLGWAMAIVADMASIKALTPISLVAHAVSSILLVAILVRAIYSARAVRNEAAMLGGTLRESVSATLRTVELQIQNARIASFAIPIAVVISAGLYLAKYLAGDLPGFGAVVGSGFTAIFGAMIGAAVWLRYRTHLAPRREELREMLRELSSEAW